MITMKRFSFLLAISLVLCTLFCISALSVFAEEPAGGSTTDTCEHVYDNSCDPDCNICKETREITHTYTNTCDTECNVCKETREITHTYTNACDTECDVCKAIRTITHTYDHDCDTDCNVCNATRKTEHKYDNIDDPECNVCKATRTVRTPLKKWWDNSNQVIGYVLAGIIFVAGAFGVYLWIPRTKEPRKFGSKH